ncbi:MAG: DoxX-like family protein [Acidobacteriota bacterium]|nr:DoxX-like family protein [Acidobacteriota bacterium]
MARKQAMHFRERLRALLETRTRFWKTHPVVMALTLATALVWLLFGIWFKVFGMVPRHRQIVAAVVGEAGAGPVTVLIGAAEIAMALWILSGVYPRACAALQSIAIVTMNALELTLAHELLLAPILMLCANTVFLIVVWYCALKTPPAQSLT